VLAFIQDSQIYDITKHDLPPYESKDEPKYHTLLCWARKDALEREWLLDTGERDAWQLARDGRELLERTIRRFRAHNLSVGECYLWTPKFKKQIDPTYQPSPSDRVRPEEALTCLEAANRLNPLRSRWYRPFSGIALFSLRRFEEAAHALKQTPLPTSWSHARLAACYAQLERTEEAQAAVAEVLRLQPDFSTAEYMRKSVLLERAEDRELLLEGLLKAGLPA
jgi:tetratricopeptide (TPR) repeat protein